MAAQGGTVNCFPKNELSNPVAEKDGTAALLPTESDHGEKTMLGTSTYSKTAWLVAALVSQTFWGCYPGFTRYLQKETNMDALCLVVTASIIGWVAISFYVIPKGLALKTLRVKYMIPYMIGAAGRAASNVYSVQFALSIYVQVINLSTPFFIAFISVFILKRNLPPYTIAAMSVSTVGAFLAVFGDIIVTGDIPENFDMDQLYGILISILSSIILAGMLVYTQTIPRETDKYGFVWCFLTSNLIFLMPVSLAIDNWTIFFDMGWEDFLILGLFVVVVYLVANLIQLQCIRHIGAPLVGTLLPWRLVIAFFLGISPFLSEPMSVMNIVGCAIVTASVGAYLYMQYRRRQLMK